MHYTSGCLSHVYLSLGPTHPTATTLTLRGFGDSDQPPRGYSVNTFAADIARAIPRIATAPVTLIAPNRNVEKIARMVKQKHPELVKRVECENPHSTYFDLRSPATRVLTRVAFTRRR